MLIFFASLTVCLATDNGETIRVFSSNNLAYSNAINVFPRPVSRKIAHRPFLHAQTTQSF